jgi:hypothetical protein
MNFKNRDKDGLFRNIFIAYFILLLHVLLLAGIGVSVILFRGVYHYLPWIMGGIGILVLSIAWIFYRRMNTSSADIKEILTMPEFRDRTVEMKFLGGLASFKISANENQQMRIGHNLPSHSGNAFIEDKIRQTENKILELTTLFEKELITTEEFKKAKQNILQG